MDSLADPPNTNIFVLQAIEGWAESVYLPVLTSAVVQNPYVQRLKITAVSIIITSHHPSSLHVFTLCKAIQIKLVLHECIQGSVLAPPAVNNRENKSSVCGFFFQSECPVGWIQSPYSRCRQTLSPLLNQLNRSGSSTSSDFSHFLLSPLTSEMLIA